MKIKTVLWIVAALLGSAILVTGRARSQGESPDATLLKPENISCQGWERNTVIVGWKDTSTGENGFKLERSDNGGAWSEIQTRTPKGDGTYDAFKDTGTDVTHNLQYRIRAYEGSNFSPYSDICDNRRIYDPQNFRIFYGLRSTSDDCPLIDGNQACLTNTTSTGGSGNPFVDLQYNALQGSADAFFRLGFAHRADQAGGGLDKPPVNVVWCDSGGCAGGGGLGLSPWLMETPFNTSTRVGDPAAYIVAMHELWHFLQFKYSKLSDPNGKWVIEGQARSVQDKVCIGGSRSSALCFDDIATGFAGYVPEVNKYLANPNRPINTTSYQAALFWTYLTEKYGTSDPGDLTERGMNLMLKFWEASEANPGLDGISTLNKALQALGTSDRFRDIWKDFAVASYAKDYNSANIYQYDDMNETGGNYNAVMLSIDEFLSLGESYLDTDESVYNWGAKYYQFRPESNVPFVNIKITQDSLSNLYYTVLGIRGNTVFHEYNLEARHLNYPLVNDSYDRVVVIVAGLENIGNYRISVNGTQPSLNILRPTLGNQARVGSMASPDKFILQVEVVDGSGVPMAGINLDNFSFIVGEEGSGGVTVPAGNIINKYSLMGQNWFVLRAPSGLSPDGDGSPNTYRLTVRYGSVLSDNEDDALDYTPRNNADSVILLDRSGSMGAYNKLLNAANAAKLYVDSWRTGDKFGLISFNHLASTDMQVTDWTDTPSGGTRQQAFTWLEGYTAAGGTRIGDTIWAGFTELQARGDASHDWALVLLSDGLEEHPGTRNFDTAVQNLVDATGKKPVIHTVAIGPNADRPRMQMAATRTGGTYQYVSETLKIAGNLKLAGALASPGGVFDLDSVANPQDINNLGLAIDYRYRNVATEILGQQQFFALVGPFNQSQDIIDIPVESGAAEMALSLSWDGLMGTKSLRDPNGSFVSPFHTDYRHAVWRVSTPMGGTWKLEINEYIIPKEQGDGDSAPQYLPPYLVQASLKTDVTMDAFIATPLEDNGYGHLQLPPGNPIHFVASLSDNAPITGALVRADVENPFGWMSSIWMWDDGNHDDGLANDGVYGGTYYQTGVNGSYNVTILALGYSPSLGEYFFRSKVLSFHAARRNQGGDEIYGQDFDGDGLPDDWEITFQPYTDPAVIDPTADPDNDGSSNETEWSTGTHPGDPDSDDDGEADGTDQFPVDPTLPPAIVPPSVFAYPGIGEVFVHYTITPTYQVIDIFRDEDDDLDEFYTFIDNQAAPNLGVYTDTLVTIGHQYCYVLAAIDGTGRRSTVSAPTCAVPNTDPLAPHGTVTINNGAQSTNTPDVLLTLWASDSVDPETYDFGPDHTPPDDSASGVTQMMISNSPDFSGAAWEAYATSKPWVLGQTSGLATVYVQYQDAVGNVSEMAVATIWIGRDPATKPIFLPIVINTD